MLFITEHAEIVDHFECVAAIAISAKIWFSNSSTLKILVFFSLAFAASEAGFLHLWHSIRSSDDNTFQCDELVNM